MTLINNVRTGLALNAVQERYNRTNSNIQNRTNAINTAQQRYAQTYADIQRNRNRPTVVVQQVEEEVKPKTILEQVLSGEAGSASTQKRVKELLAKKSLSRGQQDLLNTLLRRAAKGEGHQILGGNGYSTYTDSLGRTIRVVAQRQGDTITRAVRSSSGGYLNRYETAEAKPSQTNSLLGKEVNNTYIKPVIEQPSQPDFIEGSFLTNKDGTPKKNVVTKLSPEVAQRFEQALKEQEQNIFWNTLDTITNDTGIGYKKDEYFNIATGKVEKTSFNIIPNTISILKPNTKIQLSNDINRLAPSEKQSMITLAKIPKAWERANEMIGAIPIASFVADNFFGIKTGKALNKYTVSDIGFRVGAELESGVKMIQKAQTDIEQTGGSASRLMLPILVTSKSVLGAGVGAVELAARRPLLIPVVKGLGKLIGVVSKTLPTVSTLAGGVMTGKYVQGAISKYKTIKTSFGKSKFIGEELLIGGLLYAGGRNSKPLNLEPIKAPFKYAYAKLTGNTKLALINPINIQTQTTLGKIKARYEQGSTSGEREAARTLFMERTGIDLAKTTNTFNKNVIKVTPYDYAVNLKYKSQSYKPANIIEKHEISINGKKTTIFDERSVPTQTNIYGKPASITLRQGNELITYPAKIKPTLKESIGKEIIKGVTLQRIDVSGLRPVYGKYLDTPIAFKELGSIDKRLSFIDKPKFVVRDLQTNKIIITPNIKTVGYKTLIKKSSNDKWTEIEGVKVIAQISPTKSV